MRASCRAFLQSRSLTKSDGLVNVNRERLPEIEGTRGQRRPSITPLFTFFFLCSSCFVEGYLIGLHKPFRFLDNLFVIKYLEYSLRNRACCVEVCVYDRHKTYVHNNLIRGVCHLV